MTYKRKLIVLSSLTAFLALVYGLTLVFDSERSGRRSDAYTWLDPRLRDSVDRIDIQVPGPGDSAEGLTILRRNGLWQVVRDGREYPARETRVADFLDELSRRDSYPLRSASPSAHEGFGLSEGAASRITVRGGAGLPLLDLLAGKNDAGGEHIFLRKADGNEVRSGRDRISPYLDGRPKSWFDLRLFPESAYGPISVDSVQRLTVQGEAGDSAPALVITREQYGWRISAGDLSLGSGDLEKSRVDSYIAGIIDTAGDDFAASPSSLDSRSLSLELSDGRVLNLRLGSPDESGRREAAVFGTGDPVYVLASWAVERLFREPEYFRKAPGVP
jgi:hypothetical protein